jgi:hypothetical protein
MSFLAREAGAMHSRSLLPCTLLLGLFAAAAPALLPAATPRLLDAREVEVRSVVATQAANGATRGSLRLQLQWDQGREELQLQQNQSLGVLAERLEGKAAAFSGTLSGRPGSWAALTRIGERWTGLWFDGSHYFGIDNARALSPWNAGASRAAPGRAMVFRLADLKLDEGSFEGDTRLLTAEQMAGVVAGELAQPAQAQAMATAAAVLPTKRLSVALIGDAELLARDGTQTEANMLARLNIVDTIFATQVGVHLQAGSITLLDSSAVPAITEAGALLDWLRGFRNGSTQQRASGLSHLFTGRDLDDRTVGIAYISGLCSSSFSSSLSQATASIQTDSLIAAHEIGHVFGAPHDGDTASACAATQPIYLMAPQINNSPDFSACSLEQMAPSMARSCLAPYDAADAAVEAPQNMAIAIGQPADITVGVRSVGTAEVTNARLNITLPAGATATASGPGAVCSTSGLIVDCALGNIAPGLLRQVVLRVQYDAAMTGNVQLRVLADNDGLASNDRITLRLVAAPGADLALTPASASFTAATGDELTAALVLENRGPAAVTDARITVQVPAGLMLLRNLPEGITCVPVTEGLTCGPQALAAGASIRLTLALRADVAASYALTAQVSASAPDMNTANNQTQLEYTVNKPPAASPAAGGGGGGGGGGRWSVAMLAALAALAAVAALGRQRVAAAK